MGEYRGRIGIERSADEVFAYLADARNMPHYLPTVRNAEPNGGSVDVDGVTEGKPYHDRGPFAADAATHTLRWGSESAHGYAGELHVTGDARTATVELLLHVETHPARPGTAPRDPTEPRESPEEAIQHRVDDTLRSIKSHVENVTGGDPTMHRADDVEDGVNTSRLLGTGSATMNSDI